MTELAGAIKQAVKELFDIDIEPELSRPEEQFGDFSTNVAMQLAPTVASGLADKYKTPREIAAALAENLQNLDFIAKAEAAGPGFINFFLADKALLESFRHQPAMYAGQTVVLEHTDPNPFKEFHIGHAYSNTIGVAIGKLLQSAGAEVHQVSYHGDVGLHIAMAVWALAEELNWSAENLSPDSLRQRIGVDIGHFYAQGARAYGDNPQAKEAIERINQSIYNRDDPKINAIYDAGRQWSLGLFDAIYQKLECKFEKAYFESEVAAAGMEIVQQNLNKVFKESDGAIIYDGEKAGLHKRVFITGKGLPTYEAKELGLAFAKQRDYANADKFIVITANEIDEYFKVLVAALKEINPDLADKIQHISHGVVRFPEGKMSSRTGSVKLLSSLEADIENKLVELFGKEQAREEIVFGAIKYEFLKHRVGSDFIFDVEESVSLQGNSGPYLQYAYVRAKSILNKVESKEWRVESSSNLSPLTSNLEAGEHSLVRKLSECPEVTQKATLEMMPHHICTYLYELAQVFNRFYETSRIIGDERQAVRLYLVNWYAEVLKNGMELLNIPVLERM